jgi:hypothetical protein
MFLEPEGNVKLLKQNAIRNSSCKLPQHQINNCNETMFMSPVTKTDLEKVTKTLRGKFSAGIDEVPDHVVKQCIEHMKKPLAHTYNVSLQSGTFPGRLKLVRVKLLHKVGD